MTFFAIFKFLNITKRVSVVSYISSNVSDNSFKIFTAQCTLVHMRGLGIACRPSVRLSVCDVGGL